MLLQLWIFLKSSIPNCVISGCTVSRLKWPSRVDVLVSRHDDTLVTTYWALVLVSV